ncbi:MAG: DNA repair protein RecN [Firmicutes bacterium]|nr:DNA repair protein RecN [Bacillota bacterium]
MISYISIKDFAIIENCEVEFEKGLNIITGETGSGKSIVIEAISLALGARADSSFVRTGADKAVVQIAGDLDGEDIVITREVSASGKNLCKLNGRVVTLAELSTYCKRLADIHGQYDHQSLLNPEYHIRLIDLFHADEIAPVAQMVARLYDGYVKTSASLKKLLQSAADADKKRDLMKFQLEEIRSAKLVSGEDAELSERITLLQNSERLYQVLSRAYDALYESEPSTIDSLETVTKELEGISGFSGAISALSERISSLCYELDDIAHEIRSERDDMVFSQEELDECIERYELIQNLKRKYGNEFLDGGITPGSIEAVNNFADTIEAELKDVENSDHLKSVLEAQLETINAQLQLASERLSTLRHESAADLKKRITEQLKDLNFNNSQLDIEFTKLDSFTESGIDSVNFMISTNLGEPLKPLNKIASGGEMSRIMLAFKKIIADYDDIPTLIFDEIDSGISGIAASVVGKKLKEIAENHQIICITHLPQIAACGHTNYRISKETAGGTTKTTVSRLSDDETVREIARLLGGANITDTTLKSAKELLAASK